jgi:ABC-type phosphate/phosphonate transport system substrate-binding protein
VDGVTSTRSDAAGGPRWTSTRFLILASAATLLVVLGGSLAMWRLYEASFIHQGSATPGVHAQPDRPLVVGVARTPGGPKEWIAFARVFAQLQRDLGRPVTLRYSLDKAESARLVNAGAVDIALMSTSAYLIAQRESAIELIAAPIIEGRTDDAAVLVVRGDSESGSLDDLRGGRLAVSPDSLAGHSFIHWLFVDRDDSPGEFFSAVTESGVQDSNLAKVAEGEADATSVRRAALASWPKDTFRVVAESRPFGMPPVVAREDLDDETLAAVRRSLLSASERGVIPAASVIDGFTVPAQSDYDFSRELERLTRDIEAEPIGASGS